MTTFTLGLTALESLATLHNATPQSKADREVTPIITAVQLTVTAERWTAVATDRYIVAELSAPMGDYVHTLSDEGVTLSINSKDLGDMVKRVKATGYKYALIVTGETDWITLQAADGAILGSFRLVGGNYPPVARLFPKDDVVFATESALFDPMKLARVAKVMTPAMIKMKPSERNYVPVDIKFTKGHSERNPLGPIAITRPTVERQHEGETFRALLQPNIRLS